MRKIESAVLSRFEPADKSVMWAMPSCSDHISIKLFNNGKWMGTDFTVDLSPYLTKEDAQETYQPIGDYALKSDIPSLAGYATEEWVNSRGFLISVPDNYVTDSALVEVLTPYLKITEVQSTYATKTELTAHTDDTENPHNITKAQVGLGNVDNTSDADKPVSTAQQAAINAVDNKTTVVTQVPTLAADYTIPKNDTSREYVYEISVGETVYNITGAEGIKWANGITPTATANSIIVVSVINNLAVWGIFK